MIHHGQRLPLSLKPRNHLPCIHSRFDDLERHLAPDRLVLLGQIDHAAAAFPDLLNQAVAADPPAILLRHRGTDAEVEVSVGNLQKIGHSSLHVEQFLDALPERRIRSARLRQIACTLGRRQEQYLGENLGLTCSRVRHGPGYLRSSSRKSQVRANIQSFLAVEREIPSRSAVSSIVMPAK